MRKIKSSIKNFSLTMLVAILSFEALSFAATKLQLFLVNETPYLYKSSKNRNFQDMAYGWTEKDKWGAWHVPNATFRHTKSCFDVTMSFNDIGARDDSFNNIPQSALILLGDSFAEGYGVIREDMSEYLIEKELEISILNFGSSGNFGPLQQLLIYQEFKYLPHQGLIVYVLPSNDFTDNDIESWKKLDTSRYRPYFSSEGDPLVPYYFPTAIPRENIASSISMRFKLFIKKNFWSSNAIRTALMLVKREAKYLGDRKNVIQSFYYDSEERQQLNLVKAYEAILKTAYNRNVLFVIIPSIDDIARRESELIPNSYQNTFWYKSFLNFQKINKQRVEVLDLMEYLPTTTQDLFFNCDPHWSPLGNKWAAQVISNFILDKKLFEIKK